MWYVYMLGCQDGAIYTVVTDNIARRFKEHTQGKGGHYTRSFGVGQMVYREPFLTKQQALKREAQIKGWTKKKKLALIRGDLKSLNKL